VNKLGVVFPGQGSQFVGMLSDIAKESSVIEKTFAEASAVLNYDLWQLVAKGPSEELDKTEHTQPALLAASFALWQVMQCEPAILAGHSLGEYTALVCAQALTFKDAIRLVAARGKYMQEAVPQGVGALAAIVGLDDATVKQICEACAGSEVLMPANYNSPGQVVVAGHKAAVERAIIAAKEKGAKIAKLLPVSVPSHCALMKPAADRLAKLLDSLTIETPKIPVINNVDANFYKTPEQIRDGLVRQLYSPVRWVETIQEFSKLGITEVIECGPGKVLTGLIKRIDSNLELRSVPC